MSDMDGLDYGAILLSILLVLAGAAILLLTLLVVRRGLYVLGFSYAGKHKNKSLAKYSLVAIFFSAVFGFMFLLSEGRENLHTAGAYDKYIELALCIALFITSVILTCIVRLPKPSNDDILNKKIVQHARFAWPWRNKLVLFFCFVIIAIACYFTYQNISLNRNRIAFQNAQADINDTYADIIKKLGQPDNHRIFNFCSRPSQEFEQGPLSCYLNIDFIYGVKNYQQALGLNDQIRTVIQKSPTISQTNAPPSDIHITPAPSTYSDSNLYWYKTKRGLYCTYGYAYDNPEKTHLELKDKNKKSFYVTLGCSGDARKEYFNIQ